MSHMSTKKKSTSFDLLRRDKGAVIIETAYGPKTRSYG